jgi:hypothetical protein
LPSSKIGMTGTNNPRIGMLELIRKTDTNIGDCCSQVCCFPNGNVQQQYTRKNVRVLGACE